MSAWSADAPAKINRELRVGARRSDGFHDLLSRFSSIDLSDTLTVEASDRLELLCRGEPLDCGESNLVLRAARGLALEAGVEPRARIVLDKRIPVGAGLGGGSSDAAAALRLLRRLWDVDPSGEIVSRVAPTLGSDVPYFLVGGDADVSGRGEHVVPRPDAPAAELLLLIPPFPLSTREVFEAHARRTGEGARVAERLDLETSGKFFGPNELASAVLEVEGAMKAYLESARQVGSDSSLTGSGSTVVLIGAGTGAESWLAQRHPEARFERTRTLGRAEYVSRTTPPGGRNGHYPGQSLPGR
ncbi:MAG: 4-(cytidine 5'-diphospho)-2-C-methyl-D-erythritol kinase [Acidobacteriota bacterium]